jgi:uncharacterized SAM-binding protein YcdF (DUF218 family)
MMKRLWRALVAICASVGFLFLFATFTPFVSWYGGELAGPWSDPNGDTLIVLAAGDLDQGFPAEGTLVRCLYAVRAYQAGGFRKIVLAGYQTSEHMRRLLMAEGVPADVLVTEDASQSTHENALYTARLLAGDNASKVLLTSDYHMFRAVRAFRKAGMHVLPRPIPDVRKRAVYRSLRWQAFLEEATETLKIVYYLVRGWI